VSRDAGRSFGAIVTRAVSVWGLLVLFVLLVIVFSLLKPDTFLTYFNIRSILSNKSVQLLVALSVFIPMVANQFDLSAGFNVGISQVLAIGLQSQGLPWQAAVAAVLLMGATVGLINGLLITRVKIDSFIATLGAGSILYGLNAWYTGGQQVLAPLPPEFLAISCGSCRRRRSMRSWSASRCGSCSNTSRSADISMCSARAHARRSSMASRPNDM
jgi:ribose transport system permease protein